MYGVHRYGRGTRQSIHMMRGRQCPVILLHQSHFWQGQKTVMVLGPKISKTVLAYLKHASQLRFRVKGTSHTHVNGQIVAAPMQSKMRAQVQGSVHHAHTRYKYHMVGVEGHFGLCGGHQQYAHGAKGRRATFAA